MKKLLLIIFFPLIVFAQNSSRLQGHFGFGQGTALSADGVTSFVENPMAFSFAIDYPIFNSYYLYAEHMRSLGASGTSIGFSGLGIKIYPWLSPLHRSSAYKDLMGENLISIQGYAIYFGGTFGLAQASVPATANYSAAVAVGAYISGKAGVEIGLSKKWSFIGECNFATTLAGTGSVGFFNFTAGASFAL